MKEYPPPQPLTHAAALQLRELALAMPEAIEDFPWGDRVYKVKGKIFLFMGQFAGGYSVGVKLPYSNAMALAQPFCQPTGYGLGKAGWVSAKIADSEGVPLQLVHAWVRESYAAVAPKKLAKLLG